MSLGLRKSSRLALAAFISAVACVCAAEPPLPTPGAISDTLKPATPLEAPPAAHVENTAPPSVPDLSSTGPTVTVSRFVLTGNQIYGDDVLLPLVAGYLNRPITIGQLYQAADVISAFYAKQGYALASVAVPAQSVDKGEVTLAVSEGKIGKVGFDGNRAYRTGALKKFTSDLKPGDVYLTSNLEDDLETLNTLPGLTARAVLQPGDEYGTSDVVIKTQEKRIDAVAIADNYGRRDVGEYRYSAAVTLNAPLGIGDRLQILGTHSNTNRLNYGYVDYNAPLDFSGLRANIDYGQAEFHVAPPFSVFGQNRNFDAGIEQTFLHSTSETVSASTGYTRTDANADLLGLPIADTKLNLFTLGGNWTIVWPDGAVTQYIASIHTNFNKGTVEDRNRERFRAEVDFQHLQPLPARFEVLLHVDEVYTPDPLADTEQLSVGGPTSIRGFAPSEARGDRGYFGQLTLRRPFAIGPVTLIPRLFGDTGVVNSLDLPAGSVARNSLSSGGVGADVVYKKFNVKVDWSYPFDSKPTSDGRDDGRVYAALTAGF